MPARIVEQCRTSITATTGSELVEIKTVPNMPDMVVGDWILLDQQQQFLQLLERKTCFARKAAGSKLKTQLIAANIDTAFIVSSMNEEFNLSRIERFLALVHESGAEAVVLLSKQDQALEPEAFITQVQALDSSLMVIALNCLDATCQSRLAPWLTPGSTLAVLGSSGVGKSTLINSLVGEERQSTGHIRENDTKGRHTTTRRSLIALASGGLILDTPGIREIQLAACKTGLSVTFADIERYAAQCRFSNCQHEVEPNCAVQQAIDSGDLDQRRLTNYQKLRQEEMLNTASLSEKRASGKALSKYHKRTQHQSRRFKGK
ncbi:MAG: ribosome small subunit-dependent GTPase A [Legionellaceae bacterium]|nr:ribosome small subunit-dependent GTPase A [Legionellaceae bacterium]